MNIKHFFKVEKFDRRRIGFTSRVEEFWVRPMGKDRRVSLFRFSGCNWRVTVDGASLNLKLGEALPGANDPISAARIAGKIIRKELRSEVRYYQRKLKEFS